MSNIQGIQEGDTVYALDVLGRHACTDAPSMLFCKRCAELIVLKVHPPTPYEKRTYYECRLKNGSNSFFVTSQWITKMKHFDHNYSSFQRDIDNEKVKEYLGYRL